MTRPLPLVGMAGVVLLAVFMLERLPAVENRDQWFADGHQFVENALAMQPDTSKARNVILFIGDGMNQSTTTAARILEGQLQGGTGEEHRLAWDDFPYVGLAKTYNTNQQTPDSAGTMTAMVTGVKTKAGVLSVDQDTVRADYSTVERDRLTTIFEQAEEAGLSTGIVSTARLTHATPAACYAHSPERNWEDDSLMSDAAKAAGFPDIARQLIEWPAGNGLEVALGGGRQFFLPSDFEDPEDADAFGLREDGRNLPEEWAERGDQWRYVWNLSQFDAIDPNTTSHLLGLFERSHMEYEVDRPNDSGGEPSLAEMTTKAIEILSRNPQGFLLHVEAGRIDHAHHDNNAWRALTDTIALSDAVRTAMELTDPSETLIIVTADHGHVFTIGGYPVRGNPILGLVRENDATGEPKSQPQLDADGMPYTTLGYWNGPGHVTTRTELTNEMTTNPDYAQETAVPLVDETHSAEDVSVFATGPNAQLIHGTFEQNVIYHVIAHALRL